MKILAKPKIFPPLIRCCYFGARALNGAIHDDLHACTLIAEVISQPCGLSSAPSCCWLSIQQQWHSLKYRHYGTRQKRSLTMLHNPGRTLILPKETHITIYHVLGITIRSNYRYKMAGTRTKGRCNSYVRSLNTSEAHQDRTSVAGVIITESCSMTARTLRSTLS